MLFLLLSILGQFSGTGYADTDCYGDFSGLHSYLDGKKLRSIGPELRNESQHIVSQSGELNDGTRLKLQRGGCKHFENSLEYENLKYVRDKPSAVFAAATRLLEATPVGIDMGFKTLLLKAVKDGATKPNQIEPWLYKLPSSIRCELDARIDGHIKVFCDQ